MQIMVLGADCHRPGAGQTDHALVENNQGVTILNAIVALTRIVGLFGAVEVMHGVALNDRRRA
ncbi:hypothetical protein D3C85_1402800 [compost metagenome]